MNYLVGDCKPPRGMPKESLEVAYSRVPTLAEALKQCGQQAHIMLPPGGREVITEELSLTEDYVRVICAGNPCGPMGPVYSRSTLERWYWLLRARINHYIWRLFRKKGYTIECAPSFKSERKCMMAIDANGVEVSGIRFETPSDLTTIEMEKGEGLFLHRCMLAGLDLPHNADAIWLDCQAFDKMTADEFTTEQQQRIAKLEASDAKASDVSGDTPHA